MLAFYRAKLAPNRPPFFGAFAIPAASYTCFLTHPCVKIAISVQIFQNTEIIFIFPPTFHQNAHIITCQQDIELPWVPSIRFSEEIGSMQVINGQSNNAWASNNGRHVKDETDGRTKGRKSLQKGKKKFFGIFCQWCGGKILEVFLSQLGWVEKKLVPQTGNVLMSASSHSKIFFGR